MPSESCFLPGDAGSSCSDAAALWYYDSSVGVCTQFLYGGCGGNQNRFRTRDECRQRCGAAQGTSLSPDRWRVIVSPITASMMSLRRSLLVHNASLAVATVHITASQMLVIVIDAWSM